MILDAGFLVSVDRGEAAARAFVTAAVRTGRPLHTTAPVLAQVWRDGGRQARLAGFCRSLAIHPVDDGRAVGRLLSSSGTSDVVDAHLVVCAVRLGTGVMTGDVKDFERLADALGAARPAIHAWP